jgi:hypothetical protein
VPPDRLTVNRLRRVTGQIARQPDRLVVVQQKGSALKGWNRGGNRGKSIAQKLQQVVLPGQTVDVEWRMLYMQDDGLLTLQKENVVCVATGESPGMKRRLQAVRMGNRRHELCWHALPVSRTAHPASLSCGGLCLSGRRTAADIRV